MAFRTDNKFYQITVPSEKRPISGVVLVPIIAGLIVAYDGTNVPEDSRKLIPATGKRGAMLQRNVVPQATWDAGLLADVTFQNKLKSDLPIGTAISAEYAQESEHEGALHLDAGITISTPKDTPLTTSGGKLKIWASASDGEVVGWLRRFVTPVIPTNVFRIVVEWAA